MKFSKSIFLCAVLATMSAQAGLPGSTGEAFDLIASSVDERTASELTTTRDTIDALREELRALRQSDDADQATIDALRGELTALRQMLRDQIAAIVEDDPLLQEELKALAQETREARVAEFDARKEALFNEIIDYATPDQANSLEANRAEIEALRDELQAARSAGATREDVGDLLASMRELIDAQRDIVADIVEANQDALAEVIDQARGAREGAFGDRRGFGRGRPDLGD